MLTIMMIILAGIFVLIGFFCMLAYSNSKVEALANHLGAIFSVLLAILFILVAILFKPLH